MPYEIVRFPHDGTVDADGHVLEPAWLWEQYLEERYQPRALRVKVDDQGLEYLEIDGRPSERTNRGALGLMGAMGDESARPSPERRYMDHVPFGAGDPTERLELMRRENLDAVLLYPTIGLLWECEVTDPEITVAYQRAYNRWIADFCREAPDRLVPIAQLSFVDPARSAEELERAVADGCRGGYVPPYTHSKKPHGHPDHDVLFSKAVELDVPIGIHPTFEPFWAAPQRFKGLDPGSSNFFYNVMLRQGSQQALLSCIALGTLDRFPTLRLGVLESGSGWVGSFLDRADAVYETAAGRATQMKEKPSTYFERQCWVSGDPDETAAPLVLDHVGADNFMWATDYPHPDHPGTWAEALERFVAPLSEATRAKVLGGNVRRIFKLD